MIFQLINGYNTIFIKINLLGNQRVGFQPLFLHKGHNLHDNRRIYILSCYLKCIQVHSVLLFFDLFQIVLLFNKQQLLKCLM